MLVACNNDRPPPAPAPVRTPAANAETNTSATPPSPKVQLDPRQVYMLGSLLAPNTHYQGIADPQDPDVGYVGFSILDSANTLAIHPQEETVVHWGTGGSALREFRCDGPCSIANSAWVSPSDPERNDPKLASPGCPTNSVKGVRFARDGSRLDRCFEDRVWRDEQAKRFASEDDEVLCFHADGYLLSTDEEHATLTLTGFYADAGAPLSVDLPANRRVFAVRAVEGGFVFVLVSPFSSDSFAELWHLDFQGNAQHTSDFPPLPPGMTATVGAARGALDVDTQLWQVVVLDSTSIEGVVRRNLDESEASLEYDGVKGAFLLPTALGLFTSEGFFE